MRPSWFVLQITCILFSTGSLLAQPSILVSPISLVSSLNTGEMEPQVLNITNTGDEALEWNSNIVNNFNNRFYADRTENSRALRGGNASNTDTRVKPSGFSFVPVVETIRTRDVSIALIKEYDPWDSPGNEMVLQGLGESYDIFSHVGFSSISFYDYDLIIVASDQPQYLYDVFNDRLEEVELFVENGGVLYSMEPTRVGRMDFGANFPEVLLIRLIIAGIITLLK